MEIKMHIRNIKQTLNPWPINARKCLHPPPLNKILINPVIKNVTGPNFTINPPR